MISGKGRLYSSVWICCFLAWPLMAQDEENPKPRKNGIYIGGGAAVPSGDLRKYMTASALLNIEYSYRFLEHFQADVSIIRPMKAARSDYSNNDGELLVPLGGRGILPLARGRFELSGGGGAAYLWYDESTGYYGTCGGCKSRGGWGSYGLASMSYVLDRRKRFWVEVETRFIKGDTSGSLFGSGAKFETKDQWLTTAMNVGARF